ncbi:Alba DNA/RNA-binding protein isoform 2 [Hibiscus syriacus]|uniref:Alba DNA/RNA-binding protein isoform 2 n=1 Tax=Hibiscus syriacus TaxID=106335 RepID=A0A6A2Y5D3_HIBSY|nr:Alba DNA/RNA-binding protein isoform 2 [Hibiscus syriacus]
MDKHVKEIVLKAMGQAISKTVAITEILKKRVPRLHQDTAIIYQAPYYAEQPKPQHHCQQQQPPKQARVPYDAVNEGIHMAEVGVEAEAEGGVGTGVDTQTMEIIKITVDTQTGAEVLGKEEVGVIVVVVMQGVEVGVEAIAVDVEGWVVIAQGAVATKA